MIIRQASARTVIHPLTALTAACCLILCANGCEEKSPAEKAAAKLDKAMQQTGDTVKDAGQKIKDTTK